MKRIFSLVLVLLLLTGTALAEDTWVCPTCGANAVNNFCSYDATPRPANQGGHAVSSFLGGLLSRPDGTATETADTAITNRYSMTYSFLDCFTQQENVMDNYGNVHPAAYVGQYEREMTYQIGENETCLHGSFAIREERKNQFKECYFYVKDSDGNVIYQSESITQSRRAPVEFSYDLSGLDSVTIGFENIHDLLTDGLYIDNGNATVSIYDHTNLYGRHTLYGDLMDQFTLRDGISDVRGNVYSAAYVGYAGHNSFYDDRLPYYSTDFTFVVQPGETTICGSLAIADLNFTATTDELHVRVYNEKNVLIFDQEATGSTGLVFSCDISKCSEFTLRITGSRPNDIAAGTMVLIDELYII